MTTAAEINQAYRHCTRVAKREAKNFYYAFITLPLKKRRAIYSAYAFSRLCDDIADDDSPVEVKVQRLKEVHKQLQECYAGRPDGPIFTALSDVATEFHVPEEYFAEIISGVEMDMTWTRYRNFEQLRSYCYKVASAVGLICVQVFGYKRPEARDCAIDLGIAMQLTNIMRDVKEDAEMGRIYLPLDEIQAYGYSEQELLKGTTNQAFKDLMAFQAKRARQYFKNGGRLIPLLPVRSRACPAILAGIYSRLLDRIEKKDFMVLDGRVSLSSREKLFLMAKIWVQSLIQPSFIAQRS